MPATTAAKHIVLATRRATVSFDRKGPAVASGKENMSTPHAESSLYRPTDFAWAVASLMTLDDADEDEVGGLVFLSKPASPGWKVWTRVTDWRVEEGDALFGNFEICDDGLGRARSRALPPLNPRSPERQAWAQRKADQLDGFMRQLHADEPPLLRWIAAMVDVLPLTELGECVNFRRSLVRDGVALTTSSAVIGISQSDTATGWALRLDRRTGNEPSVSREAPADQTEHHCIYDLLFDGWVPGVPRNRWDN
jgi:hypothetical protein